MNSKQSIANFIQRASVLTILVAPLLILSVILGMSPILVLSGLVLSWLFSIYNRSLIGFAAISLVTITIVDYIMSNVFLEYPFLLDMIIVKWFAFLVIASLLIHFNKKLKLSNAKASLAALSSPLIFKRMHSKARTLFGDVDEHITSSEAGIDPSGSQHYLEQSELLSPEAPEAFKDTVTVVEPEELEDVVDSHIPQGIVSTKFFSIEESLRKELLLRSFNRDIESDLNHSSIKEVVSHVRAIPAVTKRSLRAVGNVDSRAFYDRISGSTVRASIIRSDGSRVKRGSSPRVSLRAIQQRNSAVNPEIKSRSTPIDS